eukprot:5895089-Amphidinium_carterae.1
MKSTLYNTAITFTKGTNDWDIGTSTSIFRASPKPACHSNCDAMHHPTIIVMFKIPGHLHMGMT